MKEVNHKTIRYGELIEVASLHRNNVRSFEAGYHSGRKVHYFNKKGVFVGGEYEFIPYEYVRFRNDSHVYPRHYMINKKGEYRKRLPEWFLQTWFELKCRIATALIRNTYKD